MKKNLLRVVIVILWCNLSFQHKPKPPNILFITIDDLRPELGCYGKPYIISPNIDRLASEGQLFENHFVALPTCGASRHTLLTGRYPRNASNISNDASANAFEKPVKSNTPETFVHLLKQNNYHTVGIGKISHYPEGRVYPYDESPEKARLELPLSWDEMILNTGKWKTGHNAFFGYANGSSRTSLQRQVRPYEAEDVPDEGYVDGLTAKLAIEKLQELKKQNKPFLLAVGFFKPHLPFNAPKKYWDLYDESTIALTKAPGIPDNSSKASLQTMGEFNSYQLTDEKPSLELPVSDAYARKLRHGYFACVSYVDAQIGKVLDALKAQGLDENTIIVLWGDHGWHLGDQRVWGKHTCFDVALKSPLIIKHPQLKKGIIQKPVVASVDIYPTIMEFCNIPIDDKLDGKSLEYLMKKPNKTKNDVAYSYYNKGISMRTERYRITQYFRNEKPYIELYDLKSDPYETVNVANENPNIVLELISKIAAAPNPYR